MTRTDHLLTILAEECAEVAQRASKALRFGLGEIQPGQALTNLERIEEELGDLIAVARMLGLAPSERTLADKPAKVERFLDYSERCGKLDA